MKFHRIRATEAARSLLDPYNNRMVSHTVEEGFVTNEVQADHLISLDLAIMLEANVPGPGAAPEPVVEPKAKKAKVAVADDLT